MWGGSQLEIRTNLHQNDEMLLSISGLVAEYIVAIDVTRARFPADAKAAAPLAWDRGAAGCLPVLPQSLCHTEAASMVFLGLCHLCICSHGTAT